MFEDKDTVTTATIDRFIDEALREADIELEVANVWRYEMRRLVRQRLRMMLNGERY